MADQIARAEEFERQAEKKLKGWFSSKDDAAELYEKAANSYKLAKSWDQAGSAYTKLADLHLKMDSKHEAAGAYVDAANSYKKISTARAISCLDQAVNLFSEIGRFSMAARHCKDIGELYEQEQNLEKAIIFLDRAADLFEGEEVTSTANQCKLKVAQFCGQMGDYARAIEIFEEISRYSLNNNLLKYSVKGHLLNAGICQLCKADPVAISKALDRYQDLDPTFSRSREYQLLADLSTALDEGDVNKFTGALKEYDSLSALDAWKTTLLLRVKDAIKAKELDEDDDLT